jgi:hypothetical protein
LPCLLGSGTSGLLSGTLGGTTGLLSGATGLIGLTGASGPTGSSGSSLTGSLVGGLLGACPTPTATASAP